MRKGISLVEMLMAIVLLGLLGTISYNYYKVYYDVSFAAKQARVYVIIDQAQQLSGAYDLYTVKNGIVPTTITAMVTDKQLTKVPDAIPQVTNTGWVLLPTAEIDDNAGAGTAANDVAFQYKVDTATGSLTDKINYCNILTNTFKNTWSLSSDDAAVVALGATLTLAYADAATSTDAFCYATAPTVYELIFVKTVNLN